MEIRESLRRFAETAPPLTPEQRAIIRAAFTPPLAKKPKARKSDRAA